MAKATQIVETRRQGWTHLERLCDELEASNGSRVSPEQRVRFASLYRAACADLALADTYQLPPRTVQYLHELVSRAHNQLYRSRKFRMREWTQTLLREVPVAIVRDPCVLVSAIVFWGLFLLSGVLAYQSQLWPDFAEHVVTSGVLDQMEVSFEDKIEEDRSVGHPFMAAWYFRHNTSIGLTCFVGGILLVPGLVMEAYNGIFLGTVFGYMLRPDVAARENFITFVTAHGPFELTAIVLSAGAGLRMGLGWIKTEGLRRLDSLHLAARRAMPIMGVAMVLFFLAGLVESFISGSPLPYGVKASIAVLSTIALVLYLFVLGTRRVV